MRYLKEKIDVENNAKKTKRKESRQNETQDRKKHEKESTT